MSRKERHFQGITREIRKRFPKRTISETFFVSNNFVSEGRRVLRRERFIEGAWKVLRRQKHVLSQSTTPFACTLETWSPSKLRQAKGP